MKLRVESDGTGIGTKVYAVDEGSAAHLVEGVQSVRWRLDRPRGVASATFEVKGVPIDVTAEEFIAGIVGRERAQDAEFRPDLVVHNVRALTEAEVETFKAGWEKAMAEGAGGGAVEQVQTEPDDNPGPWLGATRTTMDLRWDQVVPGDVIEANKRTVARVSKCQVHDTDAVDVEYEDGMRDHRPARLLVRISRVLPFGVSPAPVVTATLTPGKADKLMGDAEAVGVRAPSNGMLAAVRSELAELADQVTRIANRVSGQTEVVHEHSGTLQQHMGQLSAVHDYTRRIGSQLASHIESSGHVDDEVNKHGEVLKMLCEEVQKLYGALMDEAKARVADDAAMRAEVRELRDRELIAAGAEPRQVWFTTLPEDKRNALALVVNERLKQAAKYSHTHDAIAYPDGELANAAMTLAATSGISLAGRACPGWALDLRQKHSGDRRKQLVIAAALLLAEIERVSGGSGEE